MGKLRNLLVDWCVLFILNMVILFEEVIKMVLFDLIVFKFLRVFGSVIFIIVFFFIVMFLLWYKVFVSGVVIEIFMEIGEEVVINNFIGSFEGFLVCVIEVFMNFKMKDFFILFGIFLFKNKSKIRIC